LHRRSCRGALTVLVSGAACPLVVTVAAPIARVPLVATRSGHPPPLPGQTHSPCPPRGDIRRAHVPTTGTRGLPVSQKGRHLAGARRQYRDTRTRRVPE